MNKKFKITYCYREIWMVSEVVSAGNWMEALGSVMDRIGVKRASDFDYVSCMEI